jgi:hypothetical protein
MFSQTRQLASSAMKEDLRKGIELAANMAIICVSVLLATLVVKNYLITKPTTISDSVIQRYDSSTTLPLSGRGGSDSARQGNLFRWDRLGQKRQDVTVGSFE